MSGGRTPVEASGASTNMRVTWKARTTLRPPSRGGREELFNQGGLGIMDGLASRVASGYLFEWWYRDPRILCGW